VAIVLAEPVRFSAFSARTTGWPEWAEGLDVTSNACQGAGGGLDTVGDRWTVTCATDPAELNGPSDLAVVRYRSPEPVRPDRLRASADFVDASLRSFTAAVVLEAR
jgi:hypothetical protein